MTCSIFQLSSCCQESMCFPGGHARAFCGISGKVVVVLPVFVEGPAPSSSCLPSFSGMVSSWSSELLPGSEYPLSSEGRLLSGSMGGHELSAYPQASALPKAALVSRN